MADIENSFTQLRDELKAKVDAAVALLKEAKDIAANSVCVTPKGMDDWAELKEIVGEFIDLESSDYDRGWSHSGCSF